MSRFDDLPKAYDPSSVEDAISAAWEASGAFLPEALPARNQEGEPYCIVMPPPNRTGTLHMGHATMLAIEDLLIRFHRMSGKRTLWIPGTDHAAIATQVKVEQLLMKQGMKDPRKELGREAFLEKVVAFAEDSKNTINTQVRKMGSSCDWSREKYTLDGERNRAVNHMFRMMYEDGIIERGYRLVNWDPQFQTTLSDDEVQTKTVKAKLLTFTYDADFPIAISTTRPETKFGDTAVAVHPGDARYKEYVGKTFTPTFCGKTLSITVVADEAVDPAFGTGALGVTPAHSMIDAEMAERHGLTTVPVIGKDARMLPDVGSDFAGLTVVEAREKIEQALAAAGLLRAVEEIDQNLPVAERGGAPVEQLPMKQWFIRVNKPFALRQNTLGKWKRGEKATLKELMREAVASEQTTIVPERFEKIYFHWIDNLRDWCISRQIWFGHRIPVWYRGDEIVVSETSPGEGWDQDPDTLDTWFSSGLWTFSTLGWPDNASVDADGNLVKTDELAAFHPTAVLETGYDILFFWVARMILMTTYALGEVPFRDVYLHGLVRDEQGRKMSKSLGNIIDPLDVIPKYGTDAVRLSLVMGMAPGLDTKLSEAKIEGFRNFTNKLWNISRFILLQLGDGGVRADLPTFTTDADHWVFSRLLKAVNDVTYLLEDRFEFSNAGDILREFTWGELADWYLEIAKVEKGKEANLSMFLSMLLRLWHPFMPFVTEAVWKQAGFADMLMTAAWPDHDALVMQLETCGYRFAHAERFEKVRTLVTDIRRTRSERGVAPAQTVDAVYVGGDAEGFAENQVVIAQLARLSSFVPADAVPEGWTTLVSGSVTVALNLATAVDADAERAKMRKEIEQLEAYIEGQGKKLTNTEFTEKAPPAVVEGMRQKMEEAKAKCAALHERLTALG